MAIDVANNIRFNLNRDMNQAHPPMTHRETTCMDEGNADIAGANICHPWWLNTRIHAGDGHCWMRPIHLSDS